jgi:hypothetical protein
MPAVPDLVKAKAALLNELAARRAATGFNRVLPRFVSRLAVRKEVPAAWPERVALIQADFERRTLEYQQALADEAAAWEEAETKRVDWVARLLAGDVEETHHTLGEVLGGLQLPFKLNCAYFLRDSQTVYLQVELPVLDEVIPENRTKVLKSGETREVRRSKAERFADYAWLASGGCLFLTAEIFSYLPRAETVRVSAYANRLRERESDPIDSYLLDVPFQREAFVEFRRREQNLFAFIARQGGRLKQNADGGLERIEAPSWIAHEDYRHLE